MPSLLHWFNVTNSDAVELTADIYRDYWTKLYANNSLHKNLTDSDLRLLLHLPSKAHGCMLDKLLEPKPPEPYCAPLWDTLQCWPATPANTTIYLSCPESAGFNQPATQPRPNQALYRKNYGQELWEAIPSKCGKVYKGETCRPLKLRVHLALNNRLNPLGYFLFCVIETKTNSYVHNTVDSLKATIVVVFAAIDKGMIAKAYLVAHRTCTINGTWLHGDWSNYSACLNHVWFGNESIDFHNNPDVQQALLLAYIYFITSTISLILLGITIAIFCYFRSLQCSRISIHKNLVVSFILRCIVFIIMSEPYIMNQQVSYRNLKWLCKLVTTLLQYSALANIFWMFVEGLFLHNRIVVSVFNTKAPFKLFYFIGWGVPLLITIIWSSVMHSYHMKSCWENYTKVPFIFIIYAPIIVVLLANLVFLINIIFVLVTKLRAHNTVESAQIRKAIRATIVLFPLLGITNLLFFAEPGVGGTWKSTYHISNAILQSSQGIFVTVLYCFLNGEVRSVITKKWRRFLENQSMRNNIRRRSSRTSSLFLSQSEVVVMMSIRGRMRSQKQLKKRDSSLDVYSPPNGSACEVAVTSTNGGGGGGGYNSQYVAEHEL